MGFNKIANAVLAEPLISLGDWDKIVGKKQAFGHKTASMKKIAADQSKYLLSHCTIMSSVMTEESPYDYLVKPEASIYVNNNQDAWTNEVLKLSYKTFVGAFNFLEHFQNSKHAKGHILDAVLRKVTIAPGVWVYYCDILVATDLIHESLITDIRSGKHKYMSMGCVTDLVICSFCGAHVTDTSTYCTHLQWQKGTFMPDDDGIPRIISELCGHQSLPGGGVKFVEASWVGTPAFPGAVNRGTVLDGWTGPATAYTAKISSVGGFQKAASDLYVNNELPNNNLESARISADLRRRLL